MAKVITRDDTILVVVYEYGVYVLMYRSDTIS